MAGALTIDTSKLIAANVVADQLGGYNLISVSGVQATSDNQKKWCSLRTPWIDNLGVDQVMRLPRDWIITPEEKRAFLERLNNDQERDEFIRQFWVRRNPNPDSAENKFRDEHYRRIAFANMHFAAGEPGWKTDRGHVYIVFGQPDSINSYPAAGNGATKPLEIWHYRSIRVEWPPNRKNRLTLQVEVIKDFDFKFVDECDCGQYRIESPWPSDDPDTPASGSAPAQSPIK